MNSFEKYEDFFPKKVYRCPCVLPAVKHCFKNDEYSLCEILESDKSFDYGERLPFSEIFCTKVGNEKEDCLIVCIEHLRIILISKRKFKRTTEDYENGLVIPIFDEPYCRGCVKKYMRQLFSYFYFVNFDLQSCI